MKSESYEVELTSRAKRDLKKLRPWTARVAEKLVSLEQAPQAGQVLSGSLEGARALKFWLPGQGQYRAIYILIEEDHVCLVFAIGPRADIYEQATRRFSVM